MVPNGLFIIYCSFILLEICSAEALIGPVCTVHFTERCCARYKWWKSAYDCKYLTPHESSVIARYCCGGRKHNGKEISTIPADDKIIPPYASGIEAWKYGDDRDKINSEKFIVKRQAADDKIIPPYASGIEAWKYGDDRDKINSEKFIVKRQVNTCGSSLRAQTAKANLTSPNYPSPYKDNLICTWIIDAPVNYVIVIHIIDLDLEVNENCSYDYLSITIDAQVTISADKSFPNAGETVILKCSIPYFIVPARWIANNTGVTLSDCPPKGPCMPQTDSSRYIYNATAISISVTIRSFNSAKDTFGWTCRYGDISAVFVINPKIPVTTVQLTSTSGESLPSMLNVVKGGITNITCSTAPGGSSPRATFRWYKGPLNQSHISIANQSISSTPDAIMVAGQLSSTFVISFSTLTLTGDPLYQNMYIFCEARDQTNTENYTQSKKVQINIVYSANITEFVAKDNLYEIMENSTLELHCRVDSNPYPEISLFLGDVLQYATRDLSDLLYTATAGCLTGGKYICIATNPVMRRVRVSAEVDLKVRCHPRSDYRTNIASVYYASLNDNVTLAVSVIAYPEPSDIMWYHRGSETDAWQQDTNKPFPSTGLHSNISVHLGSQRDFGDYLVNMSNRLGTYEHAFHVFSRSHPRSDYRTNISSVYYASMDDSVTLAVSVIAYPVPTDIMWYHRGSETYPWQKVTNKPFPSTGLHSNISVHLGSQGDFGDYLVNMSNSLGTYEHVFHIFSRIPVTTVQLTNTSGELLPPTLNVVKGKIANITCSTAPGGSSPRATFRWYKRLLNQSRIRIDNQSIFSTTDAIMVAGQLTSTFVISYSTLTLTGDPLYHNMYIFCEARDETDTDNYTQSGEVQINILYGANITEFFAKDDIYEIMENSTLELHCRVDSNPYAEISLFLGDVLQYVTRDLSDLIYTATAGCLNGGKYICSATNSFINRARVSAEVDLKVHCHPRSDYRTNMSSEYYASMDDNVTLAVSVLAYPEPSDIMWYHRPSEIYPWQQVTNKPFPSTGLHSNISVHLGSQGDFGDYLVNMSNSLGTYEHVFHVIPIRVTQGPPAFQVMPIAGGVASGAVVAGICIIMVIMFNKRRKLRRKTGTVVELNASTNDARGLEYVEQYVNMTSERYVDLADVSRRSGDNVNTNEASHSLDYEGLTFSITEEQPYAELTDFTGRSGGNVRLTHGSDAFLTTDIYMNQETIEGEVVVYANI